MPDSDFSWQIPPATQIARERDAIKILLKTQAGLIPPIEAKGIIDRVDTIAKGKKYSDSNLLTLDDEVARKLLYIKDLQAKVEEQDLQAAEANKNKTGKGLSLLLTLLKGIQK